MPQKIRVSPAKKRKCEDSDEGEEEVEKTEVDPLLRGTLAYKTYLQFALSIAEKK